ncbi:hypothetical protein NE237_018092 [Protea cynaroides]|uniref:Uncharacterized protein n=1 Tax=Protea cynaroides TaxID=273540 RepID=A0A9Q0K992_9MAGN|nr:hypothetical protein NE237_018092 [Protea cynaroides]
MPNHLFLFVCVEFDVISSVPILNVPLFGSSAGETVAATGGADTVAPGSTRGGSSERPARVRKFVASQKGKRKGIEILRPDWGIITNDSVEEGIARDVLSLPLPRDADRLSSLLEEEFEKEYFLGGAKALNTRNSLGLKYSSLKSAHAQCIAKEEAHSKGVEESGQKIMALLEEMEQMKVEVERLKAAIDAKKKVGQGYQFEAASKDVELVQLRTAMGASEPAKQKAEGGRPAGEGQSCRGKG